jgi:hypothetical protein
MAAFELGVARLLPGDDQGNATKGIHYDAVRVVPRESTATA